VKEYKEISSLRCPLSPDDHGDHKMPIRLYEQKENDFKFYCINCDLFYKFDHFVEKNNPDIQSIIQSTIDWMKCLEEIVSNDLEGINDAKANPSTKD